MVDCCSRVSQIPPFRTRYDDSILNSIQNLKSSSKRVKDGHMPKSGIPPNIAPKNVTTENYLQIWDSSATLIGQLAIVTLFGAILGGIPLSGAYPFCIF